MVQKYRKKPVVIEAVQLNNLNAAEVVCWIGEGKAEARLILESDAAYQVGKAPPVFGVTIQTLEGEMTASLGDFVIKGVNGEFYPCKPDIFAKTYEPEEDYDGADDDDFSAAAKPLHDWLRRQGNPHMHVIVTLEGAEASIGAKAVPLKVPD